MVRVSARPPTRDCVGGSHGGADDRSIARHRFSCRDPDERRAGDGVLGAAVGSSASAAGFGAPIAAGLCTAMAVMIRPNLAPLALAFAGSAGARRTRIIVARSSCRFVVYGAAASLGPLLRDVVAGRALRRPVHFRLSRLPRFLLQRRSHSAQRPASIPSSSSRFTRRCPSPACCFVPLLLRGWRQNDTAYRAAIIVVVTAISVIAMNVALYLAYLTFTDWQTLRFMLPAMLALFLLFAAVLDGAGCGSRSGNGGWRSSPRFRSRRSCFSRVRRLKQVFARGGLASAAPPDGPLPARSAAAARRHLHLRPRRRAGALHRQARSCGSIMVAPSSLDQAVVDLRTGGYDPVFVLDVAFEHATLKERLSASSLSRSIGRPVRSLRPS